MSWKWIGTCYFLQSTLTPSSVFSVTIKHWPLTVFLAEKSTNHLVNNSFYESIHSLCEQAVVSWVSEGSWWQSDAGWKAAMLSAYLFSGASLGSRETVKRGLSNCSCCLITHRFSPLSCIFFCHIHSPLTPSFIYLYNFELGFYVC